MEVMESPKKKVFKPKKQSVFIEKPITDPPPETYPKVPEGIECLHSNKVFVKGKAGHNCNDCGFFVPISAQKKKLEEVVIPAHVAEIHQPDRRLPMPKIPDRYDFLELPRSILHLDRAGFIKEEGATGENDKRKLTELKNLLEKGYKIKSLSATPVNTYLFLFEK